MFSIGSRLAVEIKEEGAAEALAFRRITFLEYKFEHMEECLLVLQDHEKLDEEPITDRPTNDRCDLPSLIKRLDQLEYEYGWIQNAVKSLQEYTGIDEDYYPCLPYRWEGPLPQTFKYNGSLFYDRQPIVALKDGPQSHITNPQEMYLMDGYWEQVGGPRFDLKS